MTQPQQDVKFSVTEEGPAEMHLRRAILVYASKGGGSFAKTLKPASQRGRFRKRKRMLCCSATTTR